MRMILIGVWLCLSFTLCSGATGGELIPATLYGENSGQFVPVEETLPLGELLHMDTEHLFALGLGLVIGATVIAPQLEIGELSGIIIGVISGDLFYRVILAHSKNSLIPDVWF